MRVGSVVWIVVATAGCGRLGFDVDTASDGGDGNASNAPHACMTATYPPLATTDDVELSVAVTPTGAVLGWISHADGPLIGATIDATGMMPADTMGTTMKVGGWIGGSVGYIDGQLIAAESEDNATSVKLDTVNTDLTTQLEFGCPGARYAAKPPVIHTAGHLVAPIVDASSFMLETVDGFSTPVNAFSNTAIGTGIAAAEIGGTTGLFALGSTSACSIVTTPDLATIARLDRQSPCNAPRLASASNESVGFVYETSAGIAYTRTTATELATIEVQPQRTVLGAASPRIAWDGSRYWVAFLAPNGTIAVGYSDATGTHELALPLQPKHDAFELAIVGGNAWIYALDGSGLTATELCIGGA